MINIKQKDNENKNIYRLGIKYFNLDAFKRSMILAVIIGSLLTLSNQYSAVLGNESFVIIQLILAFITPFLVITLSQLYGRQQAENDRVDSKILSTSEGLIATMLTHNIPTRAFIISFFVGCLASGIIITNSLFLTESKEINWLTIIQSFLLPFLFGAFSQALTYRRYIN